jgi:hypothetical protein
MPRPIRMSKRDYNRLVNKQSGEWSAKHMTKRFKGLEKRVEGIEAWLAKIAAKVLHEKETS